MKGVSILDWYRILRVRHQWRYSRPCCGWRAKYAINGDIPGHAVAGALNTDKKGETSVGNRPNKIVHFEDLEWAPLIKGCDIASVDGDLNAEGAPFVLRLRCADGAKIPAHWHPTDENITVLRGILLVGMGKLSMKRSCKR